MCIEAYEKAAKEFKYPLHLGITEAGTAFSGTIKSSIGLGILLKQGMSMRKVASVLGISHSTISRYKAGIYKKRKN